VKKIAATESPPKETTKIVSLTSNLKRTTDTTAKSSIESNFMSIILKEFVKNMNKSFKKIYSRFTEVKYHNIILKRMKNVSLARRSTTLLKMLISLLLMWQITAL
jgi:hypothetical protein